MTKKTISFNLARILTVVRNNIPLITLLIVAAIVWSFIFVNAASQFNGTRPFRAVWNGNTEFSFLGWTFTTNFEGWADYDYYYISWADQFLSGHIPYTDDFNTIVIAGEEYSTPYFLPPLFLYLCVLGRLLPIQPFGIGLLITLFGYFTAIPIYGTAKKLYNSEKIALAATSIYLFNPLVLYHTAFDWLNPSPFVFFIMLGFFFLIRGHRTTGTFCFIIAVLFKQVALFYLLPLVAYLIKRPPVLNPDQVSLVDEKTGRLVSDEIDLIGFGKMMAKMCLFAFFVSFPYIFDFKNYLFYLLLRPGVTRLEDLTTPPEINAPITIAVPFIVLGVPEPIVALIDALCYYTVGLLIGLLPILALMLFEVKDDRHLTKYWHRMLYLTFLLILWLHIWSPRGIYKYYLVAIIPFLALFFDPRTINNSIDQTPFNLLFIGLPFLWSIAIIFINRNTYLLALVLLLITYLVPKAIGKFSGNQDPKGNTIP